MAEKYPVGTVFVQVAPSYADFFKQLGRDSREFGDAVASEMEKNDSIERAARKKGDAAGEAMAKGMRESVKRHSDDIGDNLGSSVEKSMRKHSAAAQKQIEGLLARSNDLTRTQEDNLKRVSRALRDASKSSSKDLDDTLRRVRGLSDEIGRMADTASTRDMLGLADASKELKAFDRDFRSSLADREKAEVDTLKRIEAEKKRVAAAERERLKEEDRSQKARLASLAKYQREVISQIDKALDEMGQSTNERVSKLRKDLENFRVRLRADDSDIRQVKKRLDELKREAGNISLDVDVNVDGQARAVAAFKEIDRAIADIEKRVDIHTGVRNGARTVAELRAIEKAQRSNTLSSRDSANAFRAFNGVLLAAVSLGPALVPVLAAIAGGLVALSGPLAGAAAGIGVFLLAFKGIGDAVKELGKASDNVEKDAKTIRNAARAVDDAERSLARTRRDSAEATAEARDAVVDAASDVKDAEEGVARAVEQAAERQRDAQRDVADARKRSEDMVRSSIESQRTAEERLTTAKKNARRAEIDLAEARRQAALDQIKLRFQLEQGRLDSDQSVLDVAEAQLKFNAVMADGSSTTMEKEQARINLEQAKLSQRQIRQSNKELAAEKKKADRDGVEGSDRVKNAQEALTQALKDQRDAQREVGKAAKEVDRARREGAELVKEALRAQTQVQRENSRAIDDAMDRVVEARERVADAEKNVALVSRRGAEATSDAQRNLARAQEDYRSALSETTGEASALETAMGKLSPAGREFALFIHGLRDEFREIQWMAADIILPALQQGMIDVGRAYGSGFKAFIGSISSVLANLIGQTADILRGPVMREFFSTFARMTPVFLQLFGETSLSWMQIFARFLTLSAPLSMTLAQGLADIGESVLGWTRSKEGTGVITGFFDYVRRIGPQVRDLFAAFAGAVINLGRALAPVGEFVVRQLTGFFNTIANMDPNKLRVIAVSLIGIILAFQVLTGMTALVAGVQAAYQSVIFLARAFSLVSGALGKVGGWIFAFIRSPIKSLMGAFALVRGGLAALSAAFFATPVGWVVAAILIIVGILTYLYFKVDWVRNAIDGAFRAIGNVVKWVWQKLLYPVLRAWWGYMQWMWQNIFGPVLGWIGSKFAAMGRWIAKTWRDTIFPILDVFWHLIKFIWDKVARPIFGWIGDRFAAMGRNMGKTWSGISRIFEAFRNWLKGDGILQKAIRAGVGVIKTIWDGLLRILATPAEFAMKYVINEGIIGGLRWLGDNLGMDKKDLPKKVGIPKFISDYGAFASGGIPDARKLDVYPGYTPGRDTGHVIGIGGGEAIMRPEWTRAMGRDYVERMNAAARAGGVSGVRQAMGSAYAGAYAKGGTVWPASGARSRHSRFQYPWATWAGDINEPGPQDYGNPVRAYRDGRVAQVNRWGHSYGNHIRINHPGLGSTLYAHLSSIRVRPGQTVSAGDLIGKVGSTGNSSGPHLHFEISGGPAPTGGGGSGGGEGGGSWLAQVGNKIKSIGKGLYNLITNPVDFLSKRLPWEKLKDVGIEGGSFLWDVLKGAGKKVVEYGVKWIKDKIDAFAESDHKAPKSTDFADTLLSQSAKNNQKIVQAIAKGYGWHKGGQWNALKALVAKESSWNNLAQNPTSTAFGLFQFLNSTWAGTGVKKTGDARRQAIAGLKYIDSRYGSPAAALRFHESNNWYSDGGVVPGGSETAAGEGGESSVPTMMYDNGGYLPPGLTQVVNLTGKPEPVFTAGQFEAMRSGGNGGGGDMMTNHFYEVKTRPADVVDAIEFAVKKRKMGGKYSG